MLKAAGNCEDRNGDPCSPGQTSRLPDRTSEFASARYFTTPRYQAVGLFAER